MKKIGLLVLFPVAVAMTCLLFLIRPVNAIAFPPKKTPAVKGDVRYMDLFRDKPQFEDLFLAGNDSVATIFLLGSSELTDATEATPYFFITDHFVNTKLIGVGHAGNQCFSIFSQLLAHESELENTPIVIILSPGWFQSDDAKGTASPIFLEYNSDVFLNSIVNNTSASDAVFRKYEARRIADLYTEIVNPDLTTKLLFFEHQSTKSVVHKAAYSPFILIDKALNDLKFKLLHTQRSTPKVKHKAIVPESIVIDWDSLYKTSRDTMLARSNNNSWYIDNAYYSEYVNGETGVITPVKRSENRELRDFKMLLKLLKAKKANASFVIMPLNPFYYSNIKEMDPVMNELKADVKKAGYPCLNLWNTDTKTYDKGILRDIMHLGDYGWYQVNKFIVDTYNLQK